MKQDTSRYWLLALLLSLASCAGETTTAAESGSPSVDGPLVVAAVNYPLAYLAERLGGAAVAVVLPMPTDVDPASWQPNAAEVAAFQSADLILLNGAGYAAWTRSATLPVSRAIDTSTAFADRFVQRSGLVSHSHGPEGEHDHGVTAFTTWLDPRLAVLHASAIRDAFVARMPEAAATVEAAFVELEAQLGMLDARLAAAVAQAPERAVIFSHPVYDYLTERYGIAGPSLHWEPHETPTAEQWQELELLATEHSARWLVWESEPLAATVAGLRERGLKSAVFDPCANRPDDGDLLLVMAANAEALEQVYGAAD